VEAEKLKFKPNIFKKNHKNMKLNIPLEIFIQILFFIREDIKTILNFLKVSKLFYNNLLKNEYFMKEITFKIKNNCNIKLLINNKTLKFIINLNCENFIEITDEYFNYFPSLKILNISKFNKISDISFINLNLLLYL
jgi:hypothetical protein